MRIRKKGFLDAGINDVFERNQNEYTFFEEYINRSNFFGYCYI